jgi:hypothetical protein
MKKGHVRRMPHVAITTLPGEDATPRDKLPAYT